MMEQMLRFALAGNPNSGKTTLFNALTGSTAHVGNWPGVTVDKKQGVYKKSEDPVEIIDLPGIYSLSPYTPEEVVARNFLLKERPDCIINIVDATNLERNLYLTTQLLEVDIPLVVALNMTDVLEKNGDSIDVQTLEERIGLPVVEISALHETNVDELVRRAVLAAKRGRASCTVLKNYPVGKAVENAEIALKLKGVRYPLFHAVKLVEKDELEIASHPEEAQAVQAFIRLNVGECADPEAEIADARYRYIVEKFSPTLKRAKAYEQGHLTRSDKADKILTNKWAGIPLFFVILFAVFHLTFSEDFLYLGKIIPAFGEWCAIESANVWKAVFFSGGLNSPGVMLFNLLDVGTSALGDLAVRGLENAGASEWAIGLIADGVLGGLFSVLSFLPQILVLFLLFSILEDSGYMARVAFILDRLLRRFGVSGRAFMPMIMGFGCSIPAMINTRTLADEKERTATVRVIPFFSCGAKTPILTAIAGAIVAGSANLNSADLIVYSMYLLGMIVAIVSLLLMHSTTMRGETPPFVMELPTYHMPRFRNLMLHLWDKLKHYVEKAFTVILVSCIVIWVLTNFSWKWEFLMTEVDGAMANLQMDKSILGSIGMLIQPIFTPLGFGAQLGPWGWVFAVAALTGLIAKENVIATMGALAACVTGAIVSSESGVSEVATMVAATGISVPALLSFIIFNMTTIPCFAAVASARGELGQKKFAWTLVFWVATSFIVGSIIYTIGSWWWTAFIWAAVAALVVLGIALYNKHADKKAKLLK